MNTTQNQITDQIIAEQQRLRALHPWAIPGQTSKNCKKLLQQSFPGVKFSVTLDKYSGGSTLHVHWDLGPTPKAVWKVVRPFRAGHFDGTVDLYEYDHGPERKAWSAVLGDAKFVTVGRSWVGSFEPLKTRQLKREIAQQIPSLAPYWIEALSREGQNVEIAASDLAGKIVDRTSFPAWFDGSTPWRLERVTEGEGNLISGVSFDETWRIVLDETCAPVPAVPTGNSSVGVTENPEKNGVEVRFGAKPAAEILGALKANGFRWSPNQGLWYARWTPATLAFARSLVAEEGVPACAN